MNIKLYNVISELLNKSEQSIYRQLSMAIMILDFFLRSLIPVAKPALKWGLTKRDLGWKSAVYI